ncbi:MAG: heme-binding domain-containing protein [Ignavibacteriae bacterium]|nr:heme-binding domain-containing protein [Ignavibacteriota bacterium]
MKSKILIALVLLLVIIQFFTIDKTNPPAQVDKDFITISNPPAELASMIKNSCYDCHSNQTKYPWYSNVAPVSWLLKNHIDDGRKHLNFSTWSEYDLKKKDRKLDECVEMIQSGDMPMKPYVFMHSEATLNDIQRNQLVKWLKSIKY